MCLYKKGVNLYFSYELDTWPNGLNTGFGNCLFGAVKLTKNVDPVKYKYGIGFNSCSQFTWTHACEKKIVIIFRVANSSSAHIHGRNENVLGLGKRTNTKFRKCYSNSRN